MRAMGFCTCWAVVCWVVLQFSGCQLILEEIEDPNGTSLENCGDGFIDPGEVCDSGNLDQKTCTSVGFYSGTLQCAANCTFDTSGCRQKDCSDRNWNMDIIFVVDASLSMADEQVQLQNAMSDLVSSLRKGENGLPNLHIGFITPDLGTAPFNIPGCERPGGDQGRFLKGPSNSCANPVNQKYVVDVEPVGCSIAKGVDGSGNLTCSSHACSPDHCTAINAGLMLATDTNGCPRCRNYSEQVLPDVLGCMAAIGTSGCGMEQPLEALNSALNATLIDSNAGFLRDDAALAVFFVTDEDDCSVSNTELFNPVGDINSTLGVLTSFRCTEFGVVCDEPWQRVMPQGQLAYTNCRPREMNDPKHMLHPILVGALAGPYIDRLTVGLDNNQNPKLSPSCGIPTEGADPAVRLKAFVESMMSTSLPSGSWNSICDSNFTIPLRDFGAAIMSLLAECQD